MAYTSDQYSQLVGAIAQGALVVKYADKEVTYQSFDKMIRLKRLMEKDLGIGQANVPTRHYAKFTKGLNGDCQINFDEDYIV
jgi:hypothetical protein